MPNYLILKKIKNKQDLNKAGRRLKKKRKHKGLPSGNRHSRIMAKKKKNQHHTNVDPRLGSKKLVPLTSNDSVILESITTKKPQANNQNKI